VTVPGSSQPTTARKDGIWTNASDTSSMFNAVRMRAAEINARRNEDFVVVIKRHSVRCPNTGTLIRRSIHLCSGCKEVIYSMLEGA